MLGSYFLGEQLGTLGKLGCAICLIGSVVIVLHAPPDKEVQTIDEILNYAIQPGMRRPGRFAWTVTKCDANSVKAFFSTAYVWLSSQR